MIQYFQQRKSEAQIQADLYTQLKSYGYKVILEYIHKDCRFDIIIVVNNQIALIIEVKRSSKARQDTKQLRRYRRFGVPVLLCTDSSIDTVNKICEYVQKARLTQVKETA